MSQHKDSADAMDRYKKPFRDLKSHIAANCPPAEKLAAYADNELAADEVRALKEHFDLCPVCLNALEQLQTARNTAPNPEHQVLNRPALEAEMDAKVYSYLNSLAPSKSVNKAAETGAGVLSRIKTYINKFFLPPASVYAGLAMAVLLVSLYAYAFFSRPVYFPLAHIQFSETGVVRGEGIQSESLKTGWRYFEQSRYAKAVFSLKKFLAGQPNHYQANFLVGLSYLFEARKRLLGLPYRFDLKMVNQGIGYLKKALSLTEGNAFYREDCLWYLGKAYLMLGDVDNARQQFQAILNLPQPNLMRKAAAGKMVLKLNEFSGNL
ncbi:MAG: zf-HC2 domain-containing protein [Calditrichaeota bacterium]|nr:zf-HC2 domain-containing protein [Calditrichota bacterium]